jgi:hypothetical protein
MKRFKITKFPKKIKKRLMKIMGISIFSMKVAVNKVFQVSRLIKLKIVIIVDRKDWKVFSWLRSIEKSHP